MVTKLELKAYMNAVKKALGYVPRKGQIVKDLRHELEGYLEENADATMEDVYRMFGAPETMAGQVISAMSLDEIEKNMKRVKLVRTAAVVAVVTIVVLFALTMVGIITWNYYHEPMFITEILEVIN